MAEASSGFHTTLSNFSGPLDLLLYLIRKNEIDILDIPIAEILAQYEEYVQLLKDLDVNAASDYLVMATTLMEIKSRMLLPQGDVEGDDEDIEDPRENLVKQLLEYREYKERALSLAEKLEENRQRYRRDPGVEPASLDSIELGKVSLWDLVTAFLRIRKAIAADRPGDIVYKERPLSFYMELIQAVFAEAGADTVRFEDIFLSRGPVDRYTLVGIFLSVLELVKLGALGVAQEDGAASITVRLRVADLVSCLEEMAEHRSLPEASPPEPAATPPEEEGGEAGCESH